METVTWTADMESCLFYAIMDHKPVGMYECTYSGYFTLAILNYKNLATVFLKKLLLFYRMTLKLYRFRMKKLSFHCQIMNRMKY